MDECKPGDIVASKIKPGTRMSIFKRDRQYVECSFWNEVTGTYEKAIFHIDELELD